MRADLADVWQRWLAHDLPGYLTRDPQAVAALILTPPSGWQGLVRVANRLLEIPGTGTWDLTQYQLGSLVTALQAVQWGAQLQPGMPGTLTAASLVDTTVTAPPWVLTVPTTVVWQVLRPVAWDWAQRHAALLPLLLGELTGPWLDHVGTFLNLPRYGGEPDPLYQQRLWGQALLTSTNPQAIQQFFAALGYTVTLSLPAPGQTTATVQWPTYVPQGFTYTQAQIADMITTLSAVGVLVTVVFLSALTDQLGLSDQAAASSLLQTAQSWGGPLATGFGGAQGVPWNQGTWQ